MKTLQTKQKIAISFGAVAIIFVAGAVMSLVTLLSFEPNNEQNFMPTNGMPVPGSNVPEMIVSPDDSSISSGMPVPGSNVPEMIVLPN